MNLNAVAGPYVAAVNPKIPVTIRESLGAALEPDFSQTPQYADPATFVGSVAGNVLTVASVSQGAVQKLQTIAGSGVGAGTSVVQQMTGAPGGPGTYQVSQVKDVPSTAMTAAVVVPGQVQPMSYKDLVQVSGINMNGVKWKVYLDGTFNGVVRPEMKGGDLVVIATGPHAGTWLVVLVLEQFADWCCCAITLQNDG